MPPPTNFLTFFRTPWKDDFPRVPFATPLGSAEKHPDYMAAKSGDIDAAKRLVDDLVTDDCLGKVGIIMGIRQPVIVPVIAEEATGANRIPAAYAARIAKYFGLQVNPTIVQTVRAYHTNASADHRLANHAAFDGEVDVGQEYLIVDDTMTMGGTLAGLRGHIEAHGGQVIGATTLTGFNESGQLALSEKMRHDLWNKHGVPLDEFLKQEFGFGIDSLTQGEAGHYRKALSIDAIRNRIAAARLY
ncbi:phosphoribosyltransferase [Halomonas sp. TBZ9]|uniref:Phosphoribosyltransferase n=1 Tax=Vreelandella azerica TaxID=2732867 RepID=A0A7Y3U121_9GAMM|nr:phosphoribosyltransferase [Halomonas azerica]NOG32299.1 phosphoribosyltransferase [Halomonas azerica]